MRNTTNRITSGPGGEKGHFDGYQTTNVRGEVVGESSSKGGGWTRKGWWSDNEQTPVNNALTRTSKRLTFEMIEGVTVFFVDPVLSVAVMGLMLVDIGQAFYRYLHD